MANETFEFSPRFGLIMANIKTVREIKDVIDDEGETDIKRFLKHIRNNLKDRVPDIQLWKSFIEETRISIYPDDRWKVPDEEYITITIDFINGLKPLDGDPYVGLYVPKNWPQIKLFEETLIKALPEDFKAYWNEPLDSWPIWDWVKYENCAKGEYFDINGFVDNIIELVSKLVGIQDTIDSVLNQIQQSSE